MKRLSLEQVSSVKVYISLALLVTIAFAYSLQNLFVWDDYGFIVDNPMIDLPTREIPSIFTKSLWEGAGFNEHRAYYRPLVFTLFVLNYKIWGLNPSGFHLINILFHLSSAIVLYRVGLLLFKNEKSVSFIGASIFAVHPLNNESVGRAASGDPLFGFFVILSLYLFLREKRYLSWLAFFLALLSKETAVMLPFVLLILAVHKKGMKKGITEIVPYAALIGIYLILRAMAVENVFGGRVEQSALTRILTMAVATLDYVRLLVIPYPLSPFYPARWYHSVFAPKVLLAALLFMAIILLAYKIRKDNVMLFLLVSPFIMLAPVIWRVNTFVAGWDPVYIAERFLYMPIMLFSLFVSASAVKLAGEMRKKYVSAGWLLIVIIFTIITIFSSMLWENNTSLYKKIIRESPDAAFAHYNLGLVYHRQGRINEALQEYETIIRLTPYSETVLLAMMAIAGVYANRGRLGEAAHELKMALRVNAGYADAHSKLGDVYMKLNDADNAIEQYQAVLRLASNSALTHFNLGLAYKKKGLINEAAQEFQAALKIRPDFTEARRNLELLK